MNIKEFLKKVGTVGLGHTATFLINNWFDCLLYIPVIVWLGPIKGCAVMIVLSMILNFTLLWVYDKTGRDLLGFEALKHGKSYMTAKLPKWLVKVVMAGDWIAFLGLSFYDPLFAVIYFRKYDQTFKGLSYGDWFVFLFSTVAANIGWTGLVYGGVVLFRSVKVAF